MDLLESMGWTVFVVWECQLKKKVVDSTLSELLPRLAQALGKTLKNSPGHDENVDES